MAEITTASTDKRKGFSGKSKKHSTRVDLTPMVDLGFLLITFFVFTTTMSEAKAMNMIQAADGPPTLSKASASMTILIADQKLFYYQGKLDEKHIDTQLQPTDFKAIRHLIVDKKRTTDPDFLMLIIKADDKSSFGNSINILDEIAICDIPQGHYCEDDLEPAEVAFLKAHE